LFFPHYSSLQSVLPWFYFRSPRSQLKCASPPALLFSVPVRYIFMKYTTGFLALWMGSSIVCLGSRVALCGESTLG
jgi:hypothetical protein